MNTGDERSIGFWEKIKNGIIGEAKNGYIHYYPACSKCGASMSMVNISIINPHPVSATENNLQINNNSKETFISINPNQDNLFNATINFRCPNGCHYGSSIVFSKSTSKHISMTSFGALIKIDKNVYRDDEDREQVKEIIKEQL